MYLRAGISGLVLALFFLLPWAASAKGTSTKALSSSTATESALFPRRPEISKRVSFWTRVFTEYPEHQIVIHDSRYVDKVYSVLDVRSASRRRTKALIDAERRRIRTILLGLHKRGDNPVGVSPKEWEVFELWQDVSDRDKFRTAASRIHAQPGLRNQFSAGVRVSRRYLAQMERIFHDEKVPVAITRLPLIESCFDLRAYSHKGAAGIWQFMPTTGRVYGLRVDRLIDERRDPILATRAAARYLAASYRQLGTWPLAITAYNHGGRGIARAVRAVGSNDIVDLIEQYRGRAFGFAGQNFYAEFLAALDVDRHPERYFGGLQFDAPQPTESLALPHSLDLTAAAKAAAVPRDELAALNPSLGTGIVKRGAHVPRGYELRVPAGKREDFERQLTALAAAHTARMARAGTHRVQRGETLSDIAMTYRTSVTVLERANGIHDARRLRAGQVIRIPQRDEAGTNTASAGKTTSPADEARPSGYSAQAAAGSRSTGDIRHKVTRGQTLSHIAKRYDTTVPTLKHHNGISDSRRLREGQVIIVPQGGEAGTNTASAGNTASHTDKGHPSGHSTQAAAPSESTADVRHKVGRGQTLSHIAKRYGTSVPTLKRHNGISDSRRLRAGQVIRIPRRDEAGISTPSVGKSTSGSGKRHLGGQSTQGAAPSKNTGDVRHRVSQGQTLSHIAKKYGTTVHTLKHRNGISDSRRLRAGQVIVVASVSSSANDDGYIWHRVRRGQTLSDIAKKYGTSVGSLKHHNGIRDARRLQARQVIKIPTG